MNFRAIGTFVLVWVLLFPLGWIVLDGPKVAVVELLGGTLAFACLFLMRQPMAWWRVVPAIFFVLVYAVCSYFVREPRDLFPYKAAVMLSFYGFLAGLCLRRLNDNGHPKVVATALVWFAFILAGVAMLILQTPGSARIISSSAGGEMSRANAMSDADAISYLGLFSIMNIIIGLIPFTLFSLSLFPLLLTARTLPIRLLALSAVVLAAYINIQIATRTTFAASVISSSLIVVLTLRRVSFKRRLVFAVMMALLAIAGFTYVTRNKDIFQFIGNRFADAAQDSRILIWKESLAALSRNPDGNGIRMLTTHSWAHNLLLDVGLANGWLALAAMIALCAVAFFNAWRSSRQSGFVDSSANIIILGWLISGFLALMVLPPLLPLIAMVFLGLAFFAPYTSRQEAIE